MTKDSVLQYGVLPSTVRIKQNLYVLTFALLLKFTAYKGLTSLQSSLHAKSGLGTFTQGLVSFSSFWSNLILPGYCAAKLGHKYTIVLGSLGYVLWMVANAFPSWLTLAPTSILVGFCAGPLWTAHNAFVSQLAYMQAELNNERAEVVITQFFGTFWGIFHCCRVFGAVISSLILSEGKPDLPNLDVSLCGAKSCPWNVTGKLQYGGPSDMILWTLVGTYIALAVTGFILLLCCLDNIPDEHQNTRKASHILFRTVKLFSMRTLQLILPFMFGYGVYKAFFVADWTKSYITCAIGMHYIGVCTVFEGGFRAIFAYLTGVINKWTGRAPILLSALVLEVSILVFLLSWPPDPHGGHVYFIVASLHGAALGLTTPNLNTLAAILFPDNVTAAFASFSMLDTLGHTAGYTYSNAMCISTKIYLLIVILFMGMVGYLQVEWYEKRRSKNMSLIGKVHM